uniref:hypothetical protein n=1 Tax=Pseudomonas viridiflava TaxID=33069 RepID=UPI00197E1378
LFGRLARDDIGFYERRRILRFTGDCIQRMPPPVEQAVSVDSIANAAINTFNLAIRPNTPMPALSTISLSLKVYRKSDTTRLAGPL